MPKVQLVQQLRGAFGVAKQRCHCLRVGLRVQPPKACRIIVACFMLHNRARLQQIPDAPEDLSDESSDESDSDAGDTDDDIEEHPTMTERARLAAGKAARQRLVNNF